MTQPEDGRPGQEPQGWGGAATPQPGGSSGYGDAPGWPASPYDGGPAGYPSYGTPYPDGSFTPAGSAYPPPGYPTPGYPPAGQAPGYPYPGYGGYAPPRPTNGMAIASMVLGILWIYWIGSILALIFGYVARNQIRERGEGGDGMATAGIVLGWIGIGVLVLGFVVFGITAAAGA